MTFTQIVLPNPNIPCEPGWCLQYVRQAFGAPIVEPTATAGWFNAEYKHTDMDFPENCWVPIWFELDTEPAGHVALRAPDGSVYSTTHPTSTVPTHHPDIQDLLNAYSRYNPLTYRGWTEDISNVRVVEETTIQVLGTITLGDGTEMAITKDDANLIADAILDRVVTTEDNQPNTLRWFLGSQRKGRGEDVTAIINGVLDGPAKVEGEGEEGTTSLRTEISWFRNNFRRAQNKA